MQVRFYSHTKRRNSTKLPTGGGVLYTCTLKDATTVSRPSIAIKWDGASTAPANFNYCYILDFGRYYWVNDWAYVDRQWIANCSVDVLTTYKRALALSTKYVLRSASNYDPEILDTMYTPKVPMKDVANAYSVGGGFNWATNLNGGNIIVGIVGMDDSVAYSPNGVSYYRTTPADYIQFMSDMYSESIDIVDNENYGSSFSDAIKAFSRNIVRSVTHPTQYIKSAMWFPMEFSYGNGVNPKVAGITSTAVFYPLTNPIKSETASFSVNTKPNSATDVWKNMPPYVRFTAYLPPYGTFDLDPRKLYGASTVDCFITTDAISGLSYLLISCDRAGQTNEPTFANAITQVGIPMDFSGVKGAQTSIAAIAGTVASAASGDVLGAAAGIANTLESSIPTMESRGSYGGISGDIAGKYVECVWYDVPEEDIAERGRPLCQSVQLNTLSGYVLCADGEVEVEATEEEHRELEAFLTGGFFYE